MKGAVGCDVAAVLGEGRIIDCRIPVAALPACDSRAKRVGEVVVVSGSPK